MSFEFYKHIEQEAEVAELKAIFDANQIAYEFSSSGAIIDESIVGHGVFPKYTLKLRTEDFEKCNRLIQESVKDRGFDVKNYDHLDGLSDEELKDILIHPTDWSVESVIAAKELLVKRGVHITDAEVESLQKAHLDTIRNGEKVSPVTQFLYALAIPLGFYFGLVLIVAGIVMGLYYMYGKSVDSQGVKYFRYDKRARGNGRLILFFGIMALVVQFVILINLMMKG